MSSALPSAPLSPHPAPWPLHPVRPAAGQSSSALLCPRIPRGAGGAWSGVHGISQTLPGPDLAQGTGGEAVRPAGQPKLSGAKGRVATLRGPGSRTKGEERGGKLHLWVLVGARGFLCKALGGDYRCACFSPRDRFPDRLLSWLPECPSPFSGLRAQPPATDLRGSEVTFP